MTAVKEVPFNLTNVDPVITEADGTASTWSDIWKYQVPIGIALVLLPHHSFSLYLEDATAEVGNQTCSVRIEVKDPSQSSSEIVYGPSLYIRSKEFQDKTLMARLNVAAPKVVKERQWIIIAVNDDGAIDASDSYFSLAVSQVRATLG